MSSLGNGTWEGLALAQRTLGNKAGFGFNSVNCMGRNNLSEMWFGLKEDSK